jgi:hypothetical protein
MAARLREVRQDPGFPELLLGWLIALAALAAGRAGTVATWAGLAAVVAVALVPPVVRARRSDRRRRVMLLVSGLVTAVLISAMASAGLILGVLGVIFFCGTFILGWELARAKRVESEPPARPAPTATG